MKNLKDRLRSILSRSGRFFRLDMVYATKGGFWTTLRFGAGVLISLGTMVAFGNLLSRETYGTYTYLLSLGATFSFLTLSGTGPAVIRAVARGFENVVPTALRLQLKYNVAAAATVFVGAAYYGYKGNMVFAGALAILALTFPFAEAFHIYEQVLTGRQEFRTLAKLTSAMSVLAGLATIVALFFTQNVLVLVAVYAVMSLAPNMVAYWWATRGISTEPAAPDAVDEMRRTTFHITGAGLIGTLAQYIDKIILFQVAGPGALAIYGFTIAGPERIKGLIKNWTSITLPRHAIRTLKEISDVFWIRMFLSFLIGGIMALAYAVLVPYLFHLFLPKYLDAIVYTQAYALGIIFMPAISYIGNIFAGQNMLRAIYLLSVGVNVVRITLVVVLGLAWHLWGLVLASILSYAFNLLYSILILKIESRRRVMVKSSPK
jgi:O-antigen/teichoic acid export membrane protein